MPQLPERTAADAVHAIAKAALGSVPLAGSTLSVLLETVFAPPLERRREAWLRELADVVSHLRGEVAKISPESLAANESFISAAIQATQIAYRTHQTEKIQALKAALIHSAMPNAPPEDRQAVFLRLIDELTTTHLRVLDLFNKPDQWLPVPDYPDDGWGRSAESDAIFSLVPSLGGDKEFYEQIARDLQTRGLTNQGLLTNFKIIRRGVVEPKTTEFGKALLSFISSSAT